MATNQQAFISTVSDVFNFMAPYVGGTIPSEGTDDFNNWLRWVNSKVFEDANRAFWRRLLTKKSITIPANTTTFLLPDNFSRVNGIYVFDVDGVDWNEPGNDDGQTLFVNMNGDYEHANYGKWQVDFSSPPTSEKTATLWYFFSPAICTSLDDKIIMPGEMIAFGALMEYHRAAGTEGSQDDARDEHENRFQENISLENVPSKQELLSWATHYGSRKDNVKIARNAYYSTRPGRNRA